MATASCFYSLLRGKHFEFSVLIVPTCSPSYFFQTPIRLFITLPDLTSLKCNGQVLVFMILNLPGTFEKVLYIPFSSKDFTVLVFLSHRPLCFQSVLWAPPHQPDAQSLECLRLGPQTLSSLSHHFFTDVSPPMVHLPTKDPLIYICRPDLALNPQFYSQTPTQHCIYIFMCIMTVFLTP